MHLEKDTLKGEIVSKGESSIRVVMHKGWGALNIEEEGVTLHI